MERGKYLKKTGLYFVLSMMLVASLAGCGRSSKIKINGHCNYNEWIDAIGINKHPDVYCSGYYEYANGVELYISEFNYETADEFKKIIDNHNAFVTRNPDYFPEDFDIDLIFECCGGNSQLHFSNYVDADYVDVSSIETEKSHRMRYVYPYGLKDDRLNTKFEADTIITTEANIDATGKARDWTEEFENFDTIIVRDISEFEDNINVDEALEKIQRANPDAEIYYTTNSNELTKYVPNENSK